VQGLPIVPRMRCLAVPVMIQDCARNAQNGGLDALRMRLYSGELLLFLMKAMLKLLDVARL